MLGRRAFTSKFFKRNITVEYLIPTELITERLVLRIFKENDSRDLHRYYSDEVCIKYTSGRVLTENESWKEVAVRAGHWILRGYGPYAIEEKSSGKVIGIVGLYYPNEWPEPEMTWHLVRSCFGKGYASEGAKAVLKMKKKFLPNMSLISLIHPENKASIKLALALEARFEKSIAFRNSEWNMYRHKQ